MLKGNSSITTRLTLILFASFMVLASAVLPLSLQAEDGSSSAGTPTVVQNEVALRHAGELSAAFRAATDIIRPSIVSIRRVQQIEVGMLWTTPILPKPWQRYVNDALNQAAALQNSTPVLIGPQPPPPHSDTGVLVSRDGYVLTSCDAVADANQFTVQTQAKVEYPAKVIRNDKHTGLAVLKIDAPNCDLPAAQLADFDKTHVGDWVLAIGGSSGVTVSAGIISAMIQPDGNTVAAPTCLQTDALISPANRGGPLVNLRGEVVGINTCRATQLEESRGLGVAIPSHLAQRVLNDLLPPREIAARGPFLTPSWARPLIATFKQSGHGAGVTVAGLDTFDWPTHWRELASRISTLVSEYSHHTRPTGSPATGHPAAPPESVADQSTPEAPQNRISERSVSNN